MCGRYALMASPEELAELFGLEAVFEFPPLYNIAPTQPVFTVGIGANGQREAKLVRWGLIPHWVKDPDNFTLLLNARSETAMQKASFKTAMRHRRVLIPASGFYEWYRPDDKSRPKQAHWIRPSNGGTVCFAGLVETWQGSDGSEIDTGCILTTQSNAQIGNIHHRMPVVIQPEDFDRWLDCKTVEPRDVQDLLAPAREGFFEAIAVSDRINKVTNRGPDVQAPGKAESTSKPVSEKKKAHSTDQLDLF
jgi:putative SOS response-associated peptidase YedK